MTRVAKAAVAACVGAVVAVATAYRQTRDWLGAKTEAPFRG